MANPSATSGPYTIHVAAASGPGTDVTVLCDMTTQGGGWTLVRRSNGTCHYPGTDNLAGTDVRGTYVPNATAAATFSMAFSTIPFTQYYVATGDSAKWVIINRSYLASNYDCATTPAPIVASNDSATPYTVIGCYRTTNPEDPWISAEDHTYMGYTGYADGDVHSMLYGEAGYCAWVYYLRNRNGLNVWIR
jgi:hypothetical protein